MRFFASLLSVVFLGVPAVSLAQQPTKIIHVEPVYPEQARQARIQGTVYLQITVDTAGRVSNARVFRGIPMLNQAALDAVKQWVYDPATIKTPVTLTVSVPFSVATAAPVVPPRAGEGSPPASSAARGGQSAPTTPLTTLRGFTVDVPADWNRYESGGSQHAQSSDGQARVAIADDFGSERLEAILAGSELQSAAHGEGRIFYRRVGQSGGYVIYVQLDKLVTFINCQEKKGAEGGPGGCLSIARTARFAASPAKKAPPVAGVTQKPDGTARATSAPASTPDARTTPAPGAAETAPSASAPSTAATVTTKSPDLAALAGVYAAGTLDFTVALRSDGVLTSSAPGQPIVELVPAGQLRFTFNGAPGFSAEFRRDASGAVNDVLVHQPNGSALAVRISGERLDPKIIASLAGEYEIGSAVLTVRVQGDGLTYLVPGQPLYELVYAHGLRFSVQGIAGVSIEFQRDSSGQVTGLLSRQANGDFQARRRGAAGGRFTAREGAEVQSGATQESGGRDATVPVTNVDGFTVDVPAFPATDGNEPVQNSTAGQVPR